MTNGTCAAGALVHPVGSVVTCTCDAGFHFRTLAPSIDVACERQGDAAAWAGPDPASCDGTRRAGHSVGLRLIQRHPLGGGAFTHIRVPKPPPPLNTLSTVQGCIPRSKLSTPKVRSPHSQGESSPLPMSELPSPKVIAPNSQGQNSPLPR